MTTKLFVGNIPWSQNDDGLKELFQDHGTVLTAEVVLDAHTGRSRGFGFVVMGSEEECSRAIKALDREEVGGRSINVSIAHRQSKVSAAS